jgi:hypothetical protein
MTMKNRILLIIERITLTLWVGSLCAVGLMVAPVLFMQLDDRALAGTLAGNLFTLTALLGLVCGSSLLIASILRTARYDWRAWVTTGMLLLVAAGQFVVAPMIGDLRGQGLSDSAEFARLHGLASLLFMLTAGLGLLLVAAGRAQAD